MRLATAGVVAALWACAGAPPREKAAARPAVANPQAEIAPSEWERRLRESVQRYGRPDPAEDRRLQSVALVELARFRRQRGEIEGAMECCRQALELWPDNDEAEILLMELRRK